MRPPGCRSARSGPAADDAAPWRSRKYGGDGSGRQLGRCPRPGGSVIRHAAAPAVGALAVAVVETALRAALVARFGRSHRAEPAYCAAPLRAVGVAAVTRRADGEELTALAAGSLAEGRRVHGVGARGAGSDWTTGRSPLPGSWSPGRMPLKTHACADSRLFPASAGVVVGGRPGVGPRTSQVARPS